MLKGIIKTVLLVLAIAFIATSIKELSFICAAVGGTCSGIYNNIEDWYYEKDYPIGTFRLDDGGVF